MGRYGIVVDGKLTNIVVADAETAAQQGWISANELVIGDILRDDGTWGPPVPSIEEVKAQKIADLAKHRYRIETGGITVNGIAVVTDRESQALLTGAWCRVQQDPSVVINWKGQNGWVQLDAETVEALAVATSTHIEACFITEKFHAEAIAALETLDEIIVYDFTTGWPQQKKNN